MDSKGIRVEKNVPSESAFLRACKQEEKVDLDAEDF
jgi:hypothetical protein